MCTKRKDRDFFIIGKEEWTKYKKIWFSFVKFLYLCT